MTFTTLDNVSQKRKMGYVPDLQPKWCKYCTFFSYEQKDIKTNFLTDTQPRAKTMINQNCIKGGFPVRSNSSCNLFELKEP